MHLHPFNTNYFIAERMDSSPPSLSSQLPPATPSLVSRAKTALHSAAAKAEKVITDIKADLKSDREVDGQRISRRSSEQDIVGMDESSNEPKEISEKDPSTVEVGVDSSNKSAIPAASVIKQLAAAIESGKKLKSITDKPFGETSLIKEKTGSRFSIVKSIVLREKEYKSSFDSCSSEEFQSLICSLFESEELSAQTTNGAESQTTNGTDSATVSITYIPKDIRGAPPGSFIVQLAEIIGGFKSLQKMAAFWGRVIVELRRQWDEERPIPRMPLDTNPDLNSCLLHQQLQVINCCIARKQRRIIAIESLDSFVKDSTVDNNDSVNLPGKLSPTNMIYARTNSGDYVLRLGAESPSENLTMLETGEPIYSPITQEGPVLTEELIKETEEFILRTGSVGAGCSHLLSDMQAFKAANPGCVLEDFIRWYSPPDWFEMETNDQGNNSEDGEGSSRRGRLSRRMQKEGNLWRELWESAKPLPAIKQAPLFDEDLAVESIFTALEDISPSDLFEQLFISVLCSSFLIAEAALPRGSNLSKLYSECKDYVAATCQSGISSENIGDICKVYETVETILAHPKEAIVITEHRDDTVSGESKSRFKNINLNFMRKDKQPTQKKAPKDDKKPDEKNTRMLSQLFDKKTTLFDKRPSLFSKRHPKSNPVSSSDLHSLDESEWTIV